MIFAPRQALFLKDNKRVVYVRKGNNFEAREVKIEAQNESRAAIEGTERRHRDRSGRSYWPEENRKFSAASHHGGGGAP